MFNKDERALSRLSVNRILLEPNIAKYLNELLRIHPNVFNHSINVAYLASEVSKDLLFDQDTIDNIIRGALLHDIGKISIPKELLNKPKKLTPEEWTVMKQHSSIGYDLIKDENFHTIVKQIVLYHHEKLDGSGYPQGLTEYEIPLEVQLVTILDMYDALTEKRSYGQEYDVKQALNILKEESINFAFVNVLRNCPDK